MKPNTEPDTDNPMPTTEPTVDSIRSELRGGIAETMLMCVGHAIECRPEESKLFRDRAFVLALFGYNAGLFSQEEFTDWQQGIQKGVIGNVLRKWEKP